MLTRRAHDRAALSAADLATLETHIRDNQPVGPLMGSITVVAGDTLSAIADRYLNSAARWREVYALNRRDIGSDPHHIVPGTILRLPAM